MIFWILKAKYLQINKCFIIFAFENQLALYGLAGLADEFCERGNSLKTYWLGRLLTFNLLIRKSGKFSTVTEGCATRRPRGWFYLKSLTLMLYTYYVCGYWRVGVLLHNSLPAWANWLLILVTRFYQSREWGMSRSTATHVFFINLNGRIMGIAIDLISIYGTL